MATSSFTTVFKMPKKALREIAKNIDKPVVRFKLSKKIKKVSPPVGIGSKNGWRATRAESGTADFMARIC